MSNQTYNEDFKQAAVKKLLAPESEGLNATARKISIAPSTLYGWKKKYASDTPMKKTNYNPLENWTPEQKLEAVIKTASMSEQEVGEYLRIHGLHSSDLELFKEACLPTSTLRGRPKLDPEVVELRKQKKNLERDLRRTEKALAEQSARIILLKKSHEIWGVPEDDE
jgi:transposase